MNKEAIDHLLQAQPDLRTYRESLEKLTPGAYVMHRAWGLGLITGYDAIGNRILLDFEGKANHAMDPRFCVTKLEILAPQSIIVRHAQNPSAIDELVKERPVDLVVEILKEQPNKQASTPDMEKVLSRLLGETRYKKWWASTKKLLVRDSRIQCPPHKDGAYLLRDEPVKAEDEVLEDFYITKAPKKRILLSEKLLSLSDTHEDIKEALPEVLKSLTQALQETRALNPGERLHGIWVRNDLARFLHDDVEQLLPTSASIILESKNLSELAEQIPSTRYDRFLDLIHRVHKDGADKIAFELLKNSSGKFTGECVNFLLKLKAANEIEAVLQRWLDEQSLKGPLLMWMLKNRETRKYSGMLSSLMGPRLLGAIFYAIDYEALQNASTRRIPLAEYLVDDADLIPQLLADATLETARDLAQMLMLNQGFENLDKKSLMARFIKIFPPVQSLVAGDTGPAAADRLVVSRESYEAKKREYDDLVTIKIPENKEAIAIAREHGDLRENAEYKMARQDQDTLMARKGQLEADLARAQITDFADAPTDRVGIGSVVTLRRASTSANEIFSILGAWDSDTDANILSYQTPLAKSLLGRKIGDLVRVTVAGESEDWTLLKVTRWVDRASKK